MVEFLLWTFYLYYVDPQSHPHIINTESVRIFSTNYMIKDSSNILINIYLWRIVIKKNQSYNFNNYFVATETEIDMYYVSV